MLYGDDKLMDLFLIATYGLPQDRAKAMRNEYEALLATRNEEIGQLRDEYQKLMVNWAGAVQLQGEYKARITELEVSHEQVSGFFAGAVAKARELETEVARLRKLVWLAHADDCTCEICVAMSHEPIICCICGQPITGIDIDHRFWLHKIGCNRDGCDCDLECHDECYAGHEHEHAPFDDDDEDDE
jgi:hypothetical protein